MAEGCAEEAQPRFSLAAVREIEIFLPKVLV